MVSAYVSADADDIYFPFGLSDSVKTDPSILSFRVTRTPVTHNPLSNSSAFMQIQPSFDALDTLHQLVQGYLMAGELLRGL